MTSRRDFLGILAAAPIAAPAMVKAAAAPQLASGGYVRALSLSVANLSSIDANLGVFNVGEICSDLVMTPKQIASFHSALNAPTAPNESLQRLMRSVSPWHVPNRLYGASVTAEGDAV